MAEATTVYSSPATEIPDLSLHRFLFLRVGKVGSLACVSATSLSVPSLHVFLLAASRWSFHPAGQTIRALCSAERQRKPADHILNLLLILKLARWWRCSPAAPQPQHKHWQRYSCSHCTTDTQCLGLEVLKITSVIKLEAPVSSSLSQSQAEEEEEGEGKRREEEVEGWEQLTALHSMQEPHHFNLESQQEF